MSYYEFCDQMFEDWIADKLDVSTLARNIFALQYSPEPYLRFGNQTNPIAFVTWNPGLGLCGQLLDNFDTQRSAFTRNNPYRENAISVGTWYSGPRSPIRKAAQTRIRKMRAWARELHCSGVVQFDLFPYHSPKMKKTEKLIRALLSDDRLLREYSRLLAEELANYQCVIAISGGSSV